MEAFKLATSCSANMDNYMNFSDNDGVFAGVVQMEKRVRVVKLDYDDHSVLMCSTCTGRLPSVRSTIATSSV